MIHDRNVNERQFNSEGDDRIIELTDTDLTQVQGAWGGNDERWFSHEHDDQRYRQHSWNDSEDWRYRQNDWWYHRKHRWFHRDHDDWDRR